MGPVPALLALLRWKLVGLTMHFLDKLHLLGHAEVYSEEGVDRSTASSALEHL